MSKVEVKVKKGDTWCVNPSGILVQRRDGEMRAVAGSRLLSSEWQSAHGVILFSITEPPARAWIESLGGTVVEEREEEKAVKVVAHADVSQSSADGTVMLSVEGSGPCKYRDEAKGIYRRIHIAGVTT